MKNDINKNDSIFLFSCSWFVGGIIFAQTSRKLTSYVVPFIGTNIFNSNSLSGNNFLGHYLLALFN